MIVTNFKKRQKELKNAIVGLFDSRSDKPFKILTFDSLKEAKSKVEKINNDLEKGDIEPLINLAKEAEKEI